MRKRQHKPHLQKEIFRRAAREAVGGPLPSGNVWRDRLVGALARGEGEHDWAVMARNQARASGLD
jgi:hypothetical protein